MVHRYRAGQPPIHRIINCFSRSEWYLLAVHIFINNIRVPSHLDMCRMEIYCKRCDYDLHIITFVDIEENFAWETNLIEHTDKGIYYKLIRKTHILQINIFMMFKIRIILIKLSDALFSQRNRMALNLEKGHFLSFVGQTWAILMLIYPSTPCQAFAVGGINLFFFRTALLFPSPYKIIFEIKCMNPHPSHL